MTRTPTQRCIRAIIVGIGALIGVGTITSQLKAIAQIKYLVECGATFSSPEDVVFRSYLCVVVVLICVPAGIALACYRTSPRRLILAGFVVTAMASVSWLTSSLFYTRLKEAQVMIHAPDLGALAMWRDKLLDGGYTVLGCHNLDIYVLRRSGDTERDALELLATGGPSSSVVGRVE